MSQHHTPDPLHSALDDLVRAGDLTPGQAESAWRAGRGLPAVPALRPYRLETVAIALGTALLAAAVLVSTIWSRFNGDLDWSVYLLGLASTVTLLGVALAAWKVVGDPERRANLIAWPGAVGVVAVGLMLWVAMDDADNASYVVGGVVVLLSVLGHLLVARAPFVLSGLLGLLLVYGEAFTDVIDAGGFDDLGDNFGMVAIGAVLVFTIVVTLVGRRFLASDDFIGVVSGVLAVFATVAIAAALGVINMMTAMFSDFGAIDEGPAVGMSMPDNVYENDLWVVLVGGAVLVGFWLTLSWVSGEVGYRVLSLVQCAVLVPVVAAALQTEHPSTWTAVAAATGLLVLVAALASALGLLRRTAS